MAASDNYTQPLARTGESQYACILRSRSGMNAGCIDMSVRDCTHLSGVEQQDIVDTAYMIYKIYQRQLKKIAIRDKLQLAINQWAVPKGSHRTCTCDYCTRLEELSTDV